MSIAWDMDIPSTEKMVLLCLCDYADDNGRSCYPAISTLAKRTSKNARTVQRALRWLEKSKICDSHERSGTSTNYTLNLDAFVTPDKLSPLTKTTNRGGVVSGGGRRGVTQSINEPSIEPPSNNRRARICPKPVDVSDSVWRDWIAHRKTAFTETALAGFLKQADLAGLTLEAALTESLERGWQGFKADWIKDKQNGKQRQESGMGVAERAARQAIHELSGLTGEFEEGSGQCRPSNYDGGGRILDALPNPMRTVGHATSG